MEGIEERAVEWFRVIENLIRSAYAVKVRDDSPSVFLQRAIAILDKLDYDDVSGELRGVRFYDLVREDDRLSLGIEEVYETIAKRFVEDISACLFLKR